MARGGINKVVVQQARQALIARGENPSIDAIRIELGNTGSKTTIHRYLKELNGQQPVASEGGIALSDVLSRMVGQLATQLQDEADLKIEQAESAFTRQREQLEAQLAIAQQALAAAHQQHQIDVAALAAESENCFPPKAPCRPNSCAVPALTSRWASCRCAWPTRRSR